LGNSDYKIRENSFWAKLASYKLNAPSVAMVLGSTIHLFNIGKDDFIQDEKLLKHELCHVRQFKQHGFFPFLFKYIWETIRRGYYNNKFEIEARNAEEL
jgi:hypothetical protein